MSKKGFLVKVELDIQKITCPGVWLCSNGKVSLQIYMLDSSVQTSNSKPTFPIFLHEKFVFYKTFTDDRRLNELQKSLNKEWFYAELVQWQNCGDGCVLATFQSTLDDLLYPSSFRHSASGMDIDLLMEPTELFPGKIAPKLEISSKTTIKETLYDVEEKPPKVGNSPKLLLSTQPPVKKNKPRKVCHSIAYSRALKNLPPKPKKRPMFQYRKVNDDLILRNNPNVVINQSRDPLMQHQREKSNTSKGTCRCYCSLRSRSMEALQSNQSKMVRRGGSPQNRPCTQCEMEKNHVDVYCPICNKYKTYFPPNSNNSNDIRVSSNYIFRKVQRPPKLCSHCRKLPKFHVRSRSGSPCESDISDASRKVCFCIPTEKTKSLAQQLHQRLSKTLENNNRFINNCIYYEDTTDCSEMEYKYPCWMKYKGKILST